MRSVACTMSASFSALIVFFRAHCGEHLPECLPDRFPDTALAISEPNFSSLSRGGVATIGCFLEPLRHKHDTNPKYHLLRRVPASNKLIHEFPVTLLTETGFASCDINSPGITDCFQPVQEIQKRDNREAFERFVQPDYGPIREARYWFISRSTFSAAVLASCSCSFSRVAVITS